MVSKAVIRQLRSVVGKNDVLTSQADLMVYRYDALLCEAKPAVVVFPESTEEVAALIRLANQHSIPYVARGAGTNLSGGSIPPEGGMVLEMSKMNRILKIDTENLRAVVEPGVVNLDLQNELAKLGYLYAPDPASQKVSTMGGNVAENSGGPHCLKYGVTTNHVLGLEVVFPNGEVVQLGGAAPDTPGYDLVGLHVGSEGTLGVVTKIIVRIMRQAESVKTMLAVFDSIDDAIRAVSKIIAAGILPATLEMMDKVVMCAVEESVGAGYPLDAEGVLIIEVDGAKEGLDKQADQIRDICRDANVKNVELAKDEQERDKLWSGRRGAFGALARVCKQYLVLDGTVPRNQLPLALRRVREIAQKYSLEVANVFHAGDGNLHPNLLLKSGDPEENKRAHEAGMEILKVCVDVGGTISGEHGIGKEKIAAMPFLFSPVDMEMMRRLKRVFDPENLCNPDKVLPNQENGQNVDGVRSGCS